MAKKITQKSLKHDEFVEAAFDFGHWLEENWATAVKWVATAIIVIIGVVLWFAYSRHRRVELENSLAQGIHQYEKAEQADSADPASLSAALETFEAAARKGGSTGMLARFYQGATLYRLGRLDEAAGSLQEVVDRAAPGETVGATARIMLARVHVAAGQGEKAVALLDAVVNEEGSAIPPALALLELGRIHSEAGDLDQARVIWQRVVDEYPLTSSAPEARLLLQ